MNFGINHDGFAASFGGTDCFNPYGPTSSPDAFPRSLGAIDTPAERSAFMPTVWGGKQGVGFMRFLGWYAAWPYENPQNYFSLTNQVWDATFVYSGKKVTTAYADGHAGKVGREKFIPQNFTMAQRCAVDERYWNFWGQPWGG